MHARQVPFNTSTTLFALPTRLVGYGSNTHANTGVGSKRQVIIAANTF